MNQKRIKIGLLSLLLLALSACGGSGGSAPESPPAAPPAPPPLPPTPPTSDLPDPGEVIVIDDLKQGVCANFVAGDLYVERVTVTDCSDAHDIEVSDVLERTEPMGAEYPGATRLDFDAHVACRDSFTAVTGSEVYDITDGLEIDTLTPSVFTWDDGDRAVICLIVSTSG